MPDSNRGRFVWHELMTTDPDSAVRFYTKVIGWKIQPSPDPSYRMWATGKGTVGGLMGLPPGAASPPPNWLPYIAVPDVDATVSQVQALRGRSIVPPKDIPGIGRFAVLADPQGAGFAIFRAAPGGTPPDEHSPGGFNWHEYVATDWKAGWEFYRALFGWEHESSLDMGPAGTYFMYKLAGTERAIGGFYKKETPGPSAWLCYVLVPSADRGAQAVTAAGGRILNGPMEVPGGSRIVMCADPQGAGFAMVSPAPKPTAARKPKKQAAKKRPAKKKKPAKKTSAKKKSKKRRR